MNTWYPRNHLTDLTIWTTSSSWRTWSLPTLIGWCLALVPHTSAYLTKMFYELSAKIFLTFFHTIAYLSKMCKYTCHKNYFLLQLINDGPMDLVAEILHGTPGQEIVTDFLPFSLEGSLTIFQPLRLLHKMFWQMRMILTFHWWGWPAAHNLEAAPLAWCRSESGIVPRYKY